MCISNPVGKGAPNQKDDVRLIQALLNLNLSRMPGMPFLTEDGAFGPRTLAVIQEFPCQRTRWQTHFWVRWLPQ